MATTFTKNTFGVETYKDDFADSDNYHRILFNSGRAVQARELTQAQTITQEELARLGRHVFKDGAAVEILVLQQLITHMNLLNYQALLQMTKLLHLLD